MDNSSDEDAHTAAKAVRLWAPEKAKERKSWVYFPGYEVDLSLYLDLLPFCIPDMSISKSASRCVQLLDIKAAPINLQLRPELENTLVRFKIWAGNIGVFAPGNASIDYRLRNDEDVSDILRVLLDRLRELLERAIRPPLEEEPVDDDDEIIDLRSNSSGSSSSISFDVNESDDTPASTQDRMTKANEILDDLYRLSAVLKKPASIERRCKSQSIYRKRYR